MKKAVVIGASSGIGREIASGLIRKGWKVGIVARREDLLKSLADEFPGCGVEIQAIDITEEKSVELLGSLISRLGGMDLFVNVSGRGNQNKALEPEIEIRTAELNVTGFVRMMDFAFNWFADNLRPGERGQIAAVTSIAGTKGMGTAPAYSATKRMQTTYIDALSQLARMRHINIDFTDIRPGFVRTDSTEGIPDTAAFRQGFLLLSPAQVARRALADHHFGRTTSVPGLAYRSVWTWLELPRRALRASARLARRDRSHVAAARAADPVVPAPRRAGSSPVDRQPTP